MTQQIKNKNINEKYQDLEKRITEILENGLSELYVSYIGENGLIKLRTKSKDAVLFGDVLRKLLELNLEVRYIDVDVYGYLQVSLKTNKDYDFAKAVEEETNRLQQRINEGKLRIYPERIITPDQKRPHQFTGEYI